MSAFVILIAVLLIRTAVSSSRQKRGLAPLPPIRFGAVRVRLLLWLMVAIVWGAFAFGTLLTIALSGTMPAESRLPLGAAVVLGIFTFVSGAWLFVPFRVFEPFINRGKYKLVYYLAHFSSLFTGASESFGPACFCAALALARRGSVTRAELDWLQERIAKEIRGAGAFCAAFGFSQAMEARMAEDEGRKKDADEFRDRARMLFGTIIYLSNQTAPAKVRELAREYLCLDAATRGDWSAIESLGEKDLSSTRRALRDWVRKNLLKKESPNNWRSRNALKLPLAMHLAQRSESNLSTEPDAIFARMSRDYIALSKGERLSARSILNLLSALDYFFDSRSTACKLPPELIADEDAAAEIAEVISDSLFEAIRSRSAPVFALKIHGAISARVYQKLESFVQQELHAALQSIRDRTVRKLRGSSRDEWLETARVRALYRRVEYTLGTRAAGAHAQAMFFNYGNFGVMLSETNPRRRPIAHAVFHCLRNEAQRFEHADALKRENKNMGITARGT